MENTKKTKLMIIENYIDWFTTDDFERQVMKENARLYVEEDWVDEIAQSKEPTVNAQFDEEDMWINCPHCDNTEQQPVDQQRHHLQSLVLLDWESEKISKHQCLSCDGLFKVNWESYES